MDTEGARLELGRVHGLLPLFGPRGEAAYARGPVGIVDDCVLGEMEGSWDEACSPGGGSRAKVGDMFMEGGFVILCGSVVPEIESRFAMAAGAVGGDRSERWLYAWAARIGPSC